MTKKVRPAIKELQERPENLKARCETSQLLTHSKGKNISNFES
jgi:hypothetical protein